MATYTDSNVLFSNHVLYRKSLGTQTTQNNRDARVTWFTVPSGKYLRFLSIFPTSHPGFGGDEDHNFEMYMDSDSLIGENNADRSGVVDYEYTIQLSQTNVDGTGGFLSGAHVGYRMVYLFDTVTNDNVSGTSYAGSVTHQYPINNGGYPDDYTHINTGHWTNFGISGTSAAGLPYFPPGTVVQYNRPSIAGPSPENYNLHIMYYLADYAGLTVNPTNA